MTSDLHKEQLKKAKDFIEELSQRNLIHDSTDRERLAVLLACGKRVYMGIDPTADFLHLGHYVGLSLLKRFIRAGYPVVILVGSLTARIGDPSWRSKARKFNPNIDHNGQSIREQLSCLFEEEMKIRKHGYPMLEIVDNYQFHNDRLLGHVHLQKKPLDVLLEFLTDVCSNLKVSELVHRDFLRDRLQKGLTLQEFLYTCLQGWDFLYLHQQKGVSIQIGGSDQWGNMITGLRLIDKFLHKEKHLDGSSSEEETNQEVLDNFIKRSNHAGIITFPIVNDKSGNKFGKSEGNAICISGGDSEKNAYSVRQYFLNADDSQVKDYLLKFTQFSLEEVADIMLDSRKEAKSKLADAVCSDIFGSEISRISGIVSKGMFGELALATTYEELIKYSRFLPSGNCHWEDKIQIFSLFKLLNFVESRSEFNRLIEGGGISVGQLQLSNPNFALSPEDVIWKNAEQEKGIVVVRKGKKQYGLIHFHRLSTPLND